MAEAEDQITALIEEVLKARAKELNLAYASRYFTTAGLVLLIHDIIVTFSRERNLIWKAKWSFTKIAFLYNRYSMPVCLFLAWITMSGFIGIGLNDKSCQVIFILVTILAFTMIPTVNCLVLIRIISLWEGQRWATLTMIAGFVASFSVVAVSLVLSLTTFIHHLAWSPIVGFCDPPKTSPLLTVAWGTSTLYSIINLVAVCMNAFDRPRAVGQSLAQALSQDGVEIFAGFVLFQVVILCMAATQEPRYGFLMIFFCWAVSSILVSRLILRLQHLDSVAAALRVGARQVTPLTYAAAAAERDRERGADLIRGGTSQGSIKGDVAEWELEPRRLTIEVGRAQWTD